MPRYLVILLLLLSLSDRAQQDSSKKINYNARKAIVGISSAAVTAGSILYLNYAWFEDYNTGKFHFFNDNAEWNQMDKFGHAYTTYQTGRLMMKTFDWAGFDRKTELFVAGGLGLYYMTAIEMMDGFSDGWGFSWGDMAANAGGAALVVSQEAFWKEQRISLKFSYGESGLAHHNPELLGENMLTRVLKDYNGQTYWLSVNPSSFLKKENKFPKWLSIAFGYSSFGMIGARNDLYFFKGDDGGYYMWEKERRFYASIDIDLTRIKTRSKLLKTLFSMFNTVKIPAPALQFSKKGTKGYLIYY